ncbi:unnamed protein product [Rangifer tarandus platyrhynchus]|uniref:Uncharacterized protein n=2 Tax=Rangifer tarandus platyrhynchus TaxID=3082113 RepID=A0ABN8XZX0_RANTA|nr:unnamed protein product [Rangifer tarandus platyrhynchus]CAI9692550.1 unnamed protein product [Rangifer tarandus platyrhynchus]
MGRLQPSRDRSLRPHLGAPPSVDGRVSGGGGLAAPSGRRDAEALLVPLGVGSWAGLNHTRSGTAPGGGGTAPEPCRRVPVCPEPGFSVVHEEDLGRNCCPAPDTTGWAHCEDRTRERESTEQPRDNHASRCPGAQRPRCGLPTGVHRVWREESSEGRTAGSLLILKLLTKNHELRFFGN